MATIQACIDERVVRANSDKREEKRGRKGERWCGAKHANIVSRAVVIRNEQSQGLEGKASVRAVRLWIVIHAGDKKIFYHWVSSVSSVDEATRVLAALQSSLGVIT